jgi:hypothetical protein
VNHQGNVFVVDTGNARIVVFDWDGNHMFNLGNKGEGPGEFQVPTDVDFLSDHRILVADQGLRRINFFEASGKFIKSIKISDHSVGRILSLGDKGFLLSKNDGFSYSIRMKFNPEERRFHIYDLEGNKTLAFGEPTHHENALLRTRFNTGSIVKLEDRFIFAGSIENILFIYNSQGQIIDERPYAIELVPIEPDSRMVQFKNANGDDNFTMQVIADKLCISLATLPNNELLMLRAVEHTPDQSSIPKSELARLTVEGHLVKKYPETLDALAVATNQEGTHAFILIETDRNYEVIMREL